MYRASDQVANESWLAELQTAAERLDLGSEAQSSAMDLFLSDVPEAERSKRPALAAALYVGTLVAGEQRSQQAVADAVGVSRLAVQQRWKPMLESAGLDAPDW